MTQPTHIHIRLCLTGKQISNMEDLGSGDSTLMCNEHQYRITNIIVGVVPVGNKNPVEIHQGSHIDITSHFLQLVHCPSLFNWQENFKYGRFGVR